MTKKEFLDYVDTKIDDFINRIKAKKNVKKSK